MNNLTLPEVVLIVGLAFIVSQAALSLFSWFIVFPWQQREAGEIDDESNRRRMAELREKLDQKRSPKP